MAVGEERRGKTRRAKAGKVYLVGAGPGGAEYLTLRAQQLLAQATVVIYDALADQELLRLTEPGCLHLDVGKRGGEESAAQAEINQLLVSHCQTGAQVVRLKSGDPFIFGRAVPEVQVLVEAGCAFEVVPGISSALAAPLFAGLPLTEQHSSRCFAVLSGHDLELLPWSALAQLDTLAILMGTRQLAEITARLVASGRVASTPVAIVRWGGRPQQQVWTGTLADIAEQTKGIQLSPAVIVVGEVVKYRQWLRWYDARPLSGKTVLVTRSVEQSGQFTELLREQGARVVEMPALVIGPPSDECQALDQAIAELASFQWLILTSTNAVEVFFERLAICGLDARALAGLKIAVVGRKTAQSLRAWNLNPDFVPPDFVADSLVEHFPEANLQGVRLLFPRVESGGRDALVAGFRQRGADVVEVAGYQSSCPDQAEPQAVAALQAGEVNFVTFASSKTVRNFVKLLSPHNWQPWLQAVTIASIGPQTSQTCIELLGRVDLEATEYTLEGLTEVIVAGASEPRSEAHA
ncbi:uroporphyrinogen-III C-methyltransferase [Leptolyngbya sp. FACHB-261]|uniref:uroporphyrinogen-III C-methyltransferase n=1 Tax=Leptolyngbya sp. FACHB-261 TaxID=2692806 RepID=UPI00168793D6|nr:uroporphyrinogen-III C-methyltransferase [Leptolyngbya sp. FACHB-261]MBD2103196.1 uroporphyrinogen-III C-methyltransferase [Leptolyngbya sp. FACHB-261]